MSMQINTWHFQSSSYPLYYLKQSWLSIHRKFLNAHSGTHLQKTKKEHFIQHHYKHFYKMFYQN